MIREDLLNHLTDRYSHLTKSEKKVADFIFANKTEAIYMSITNLAESCGVGDATIFRFCKTLGFPGYNDFKLSLAKSITTTAENEDELFGEVLAEDSISAMCKKLANSNIAAINQTLEMLDEANLSRAVSMLCAAKRVYCLGQGTSLVTAMEASSRFLSVSPDFITIQDSHLQAMAAALMKEGDVVLFFSYSGATRDMADVLRPARESGARVILVTRFTKSPATAFADVVLLCGSNEGPLQSGSVPAKIAQLLIIDILYNEYCRRNPRVCAKNREATVNAVSYKLL